jgi:hypothetical protein
MEYLELLAIVSYARLLRHAITNLRSLLPLNLPYVRACLVLPVITN